MLSSDQIVDAMSTTSEQIKVWRLPQLAGIELHRGKAVTRDCPRHWHEELHLCVIESGGGELHYRGTECSDTRAIPVYCSTGRDSRKLH